jgi:hypothetical protein
VGVGDEVEVEVSAVDISKRQVGLLLVKISKQMGREINIELRAADRESEARLVGYEERRAAWLAQQGGKGGARGGRGGGGGKNGSPPARQGRGDDGNDRGRRGRSPKSKGAKKGRRGQGRTKRR